MTLGELLRRLRERSPSGRTSVTAASRALEIPRTTIYMWEGPTSRPEPEDLRRYLEWLGAPEAWILVALDLRSRAPGTALDEDEIPTEIAVQGAA